MVAKNKFYELHLIKYNLFKKQDPEIVFFDVVFEIEGKVLYAHKTMLILVSPTFASMLSDRWTSKKNESIKIKDYSFNDFYQFITFLYSGECQLTDSIIYSMVDIAEFYGVQLFKDYCDEYLSNMKITVQNIFPLMELAEKYLMIQFKVLVFDFVKNNFQSIVDADEFLKLGKDDVKEIVISAKNEVEPEDLFQAVYKWAENQAIDIHVVDPNLNLNETIKAEIADFLPYIRFYEMELKFLHEFVECKIPSTPSPLKKRDGIEWYLIYYNDGQIGLKRCSIIRESNYLLAELTAGNSRFETADGSKIEIE